MPTQELKLGVIAHARNYGPVIFDPLAAATQLTALTGLTLRRFSEDNCLRRLAASPLFARLRHLRLDGDLRYPYAWKMSSWEPSTLSGLTLPLLEDLDLKSWRTFRGLARVRLPALRQLTLTECSYTAAADVFRELEDGKAAPALEYLVIDGAQGEVACCVEELSAHTPPALRALAVTGADGAVMALAALPFASQLTRIELGWKLRYGPLGPDGCAALAAAPLPSLRVLVVDAALTLGAASALAQAPWLGALSRLVLNTDYSSLSHYRAPPSWQSTLAALRAWPAFRALEGAGRVRLETRRTLRISVRGEPAYIDD